MIKLIKGGEVYSPKYLGKKDILIGGEKILGIYDNLNIKERELKVDIIDAEGKIVFPGFIDSHMHMIGGGGEGGFKTRTPEIQLSSITRAGVTTAVGCLGTDGIFRNGASLYGKAKSLEEEGITTYMYTGAYQLPVKTITGSIKEDIMLIDKVIGVGEIAISDHRSSHPTSSEIGKIAAEARVAGLLSGKAGIVHVHVGDGKDKLKPIIEIVEESDIPITQFVPTHINRSKELFNEGIKFTEMGGRVDLTTSSDPNHLEKTELRASEALKLLLDSGVPIRNIQFSSDSQGSMPIFNERGEYEGLGIGSVKSLYDEVKNSILKYGVAIEEAIAVITSNVADNLNLSNKGRIKEGLDGDLVIVNKEDLEIREVISKGNHMIGNGEVLTWGTFEKIIYNNG